jgi:hypothetical protein
VPVQIKLSFIEDSAPSQRTWSELQEDEKRAAIEALARLIARMIGADKKPGEQS